MSMKPQELSPIPEETRRIARQAFPKGTLAMEIRDSLGPIYSDEPFAHLFPKRGRGAEAPWRLALVTVLQTMENLTDRQAAQQVSGRIDWKYALSLPLEEASFDYSILSEFRQRLIEHHAEALVLDPILQLCRERGWLKAGGKQRTDATHVLASVRALNSLESVGETMRATLNALAETEPEWLLEHMEPEWFERYVHRFELARFPKAETQRRALRLQVGEDVERLLEVMEQPETPAAARRVAEVALLRRVFEQHYEVQEGKVRWRDGPAVCNEERVVSPYDADARSSRKRDTVWLGYKVHLTETCDQQEEAPHLIVHVETTPSTIQDSEMLVPICQGTRERGLAAREHLVDQGYTSGEALATQREHGTEIIGPVAQAPSWQGRAQTGYAPEDFELNWQTKVATCPQGQHSVRWKTTQDRRDKEILVIQFDARHCQGCPVQSLCTHNQEGRRLTLTPQASQQALIQRREEQQTKEFGQRSGLRAGIEGTISQAIRTMGGRRSRYQGLAKTHLQHVRMAGALNLVRIATHLQRQRQGKPARPARPLSPLARLKKKMAEERAIA